MKWQKTDPKQPTIPFVITGFRALAVIKALSSTDCETKAPKVSLKVIEIKPLNLKILEDLINFQQTKFRKQEVNVANKEQLKKLANQSIKGLWIC